jgi:crotonobetainyl-CoA:carnitine CoA-transferase CaiB-like acyl-CoA transferase
MPTRRRDLAANDLPLAGLKIIEFTHMVMGPSIGLILADLGADVVKVEPPGGDLTRQLLGSGAGYFPMFNRNKRSICLDLKSTADLDAARRLCATADIVIENFRLGTLDRLGLGYEALRVLNKRLIFCAAKGFLSGPYENRTALDEVAQMMGGLAYMTGPPGQPLRAGASVIDITGGMFGVIGILAALERRHRTGEGGLVKCSLFETTAFLVGQHMAQKAVTGESAQPMPARISAWAIYDVFETKHNAEQIFVGVVSDSQWRLFCAAFGLTDLLQNPDFATNNQRVMARPAILPVVRATLRQVSRGELVERLATLGLPIAPIARPEDLFDDPHLVESGGLTEVTIPGRPSTSLPKTPIELDGQRMPRRYDVPDAGAHGSEILQAIGLGETKIDSAIGAKNQQNL